VRSALQAIGFSGVATHFVSEPPFAQIDLPTVAARAGTGYELSFFNLLGSELEDALRSRRTYIELNGLSDCVKALRAKKNWCRSCAMFCEEIVSFTRMRIETLQPERNTLLTLS
jgi:hypothetical protein